MFGRTENYPLIIQKKSGRDFKRICHLNHLILKRRMFRVIFMTSSAQALLIKSVSICTQEVLLSTFVHIFVINSLRVAQDNEKLH